MEAAIETGMLMGMKWIYLSGCSQLTDKAIFFLVARESSPEWRYISLSGCQVSDRAILALIARCPSLSQVRRSDTTVLDPTQIYVIRNWILQHQMTLDHMGRQPWWKYADLSIDSILAQPLTYRPQLVAPQ